jgi:hypothetical protein
MLELFPNCKKLNAIVAICDRFVVRLRRGDEGRAQMVIGVVVSGVMAGFGTAMLSVAAGHPFQTTLLVYMTAGLIGSLGFVAATARQEVDVLR